MSDQYTVWKLFIGHEDAKGLPEETAEIYHDLILEALNEKLAPAFIDLECEDYGSPNAVFDVEDLDD